MKITDKLKESLVYTINVNDLSPEYLISEILRILEAYEPEETNGYALLHAQHQEQINFLLKAVDGLNDSVTGLLMEAAKERSKLLKSQNQFNPVKKWVKIVKKRGAFEVGMVVGILRQNQSLSGAFFTCVNEFGIIDDLTIEDFEELNPF